MVTKGKRKDKDLLYEFQATYGENVQIRKNGRNLDITIGNHDSQETRSVILPPKEFPKLLEAVRKVVSTRITK